MAYQNNAYGAYMKKRDAEGRADFWKKTVLPIAAFATGGAALAAVGGGAAAGGAATAAGSAASSAPATMVTSAGGWMPTAAGASMSAAPQAVSASMPWLRLSEIGVGAGMNLWGGRQANKAAERAAQIEAVALAKQEALTREQIALEREAWMASQEQQRLDRLAADEERAYSRDERDYKRRLDEEREARRAPYRQMGQQALMSLASISGLRLDPSMFAAPVVRSGSASPARSGAPVSSTMPVRERGSAAYITPAGQDDGARQIYEMTGGRNGGFVSPRPRLIPLGQVGY